VDICDVNPRVPDAACAKLVGHDSGLVGRRTEDNDYGCAPTTGRDQSGLVIPVSCDRPDDMLERHDQKWFKNFGGTFFVCHNHNSLVHCHKLGMLDRNPPFVGQTKLKFAKRLFPQCVTN